MKRSFFDYQQFSRLLRDSILLQPQKGRGLVKALAEELRVTSPQISQFLAEKKTPTVDQAYQIAKFFKWNEFETEYALTLIEYERSSHHETRAYFEKKLTKLRQASMKISTSVDGAKELTENEKAQFYSSWINSAIRLFCSIGDGKTHQEIEIAFPEFKDEIKDAIEFLLKAQLIKKEGIRYQMGVQKTFVPKGSPFLRSHHANWRLRAIERSVFINDEELMFTAPMSISKDGFKVMRFELQEWIKNISARLPELGDAEEVVCLNLDFFRIAK